MFKIFILNGQGKSGKDTFYNIINQYDQALYNCIRTAKTSMIDRTKEIAKRCGWTGGKELKDREFLFNLKQLLTKYNDLPYMTIKSEVEYYKNSLNLPFVFIDAREVKDIERLCTDFPCITILIKRGDSKVFNNQADDNVFDYQYDYVIENDGSLEDFKDTCHTFWNTILNELDSLPKV